MTELRTRGQINKTKLDALERATAWTEQARLKTGPGERPWVAANDRILYPRQVRIPETMYLKLKYLVDHVPNTSMHSIIMRAIDRELERMLDTIEPSQP